MTTDMEDRFMKSVVYKGENKFRMLDVFTLSGCTTHAGGSHTHETIIPKLQEGGIVLTGTLKFLSMEVYGKQDSAQYDLRNCFKCGEIIGFGLFRIRNGKHIPLVELQKIWRSPHVELFCCKCYGHKKLEEIIEKKQKRLLNKARRISEKFGFDNEYESEF